MFDLQGQFQHIKEQMEEDARKQKEAAALAAASEVAFKTAIKEAIDKAIATVSLAVQPRLVAKYIKLYHSDNAALGWAKLFDRVLRHPTQGLRSTDAGYWYNGATFTNPLDILKQFQDTEVSRELSDVAAYELFNQVLTKQETHFGEVRAIQERASKVDYTALTTEALFELQALTGSAF